MLCSRKFGLNREATLSGIGDWRLESVNMVILRGEKDASACTVERVKWYPIFLCRLSIVTFFLLKKSSIDL